jgi:uncharacterized membrane protein YgcG
MSRRLIALAAAAAMLVAGCATDESYLRAQADAAIADGNARVAEAQAKAEEARAVIAVAGKLDAGGAAAYVLGMTLKGAAGAQRTAPVTVQRPRDALDYIHAATGVVSALGTIAVPIVTVKEAGKTQRAGFERDMGVENARQAGESHRIGSVAQIARDVAASRPSVTNTYTVGGDGVIGDGTYTVSTTTTTNRHCQGGTAAPGGAGGQGTTAGGSGASGGSAPGGSC